MGSLSRSQKKATLENTIYEICLQVENTITCAYVAENEMTLKSTLSSLNIC